MFIMQNNESRLIKAAKRTIRAEVTLVIVIIVISSWSIYALYKLAYSSDILSGLMNSSTSTKSTSSRTNSSEVASLTSQQQLDGDPPTGDQHIGHYRAGSSRQSLPDSQPDAAAQYRARLLQELMAGQQELYANLGAAFRTHPFSGLRLEAQRQPILRQSVLADPLDLPLEQQITRPVTGRKLHVSNSDLRKTRNNQREDEILPTTATARLRPTPPYLAPATRPDALSRVQVVEPASVRDEERQLQQIQQDAADREAAESNTDSGESIVNGSPSQQPEDPSQSSDEPELSDVGASDDADSSDENSQENNSQVDNAQDTGVGEQSERSSSGNQESAEQPTSAKESAGTIDEEVDRISQPSLGSVRHFKSPGHDDYVKNTVQFDDFLSNGSGSLAAPRSVPAGNQIARFEAPRQTQGSAREQGNDPQEPNDRAAQDLQIDHNSPIAGSAVGTSTETQTHTNSTQGDHSAANLQDGEISVPRKKRKVTKKRANRTDTKQESEVDVVQAVTGEKRVNDRNLLDEIGTRSSKTNTANKKREKRSTGRLIKRRLKRAIAAEQKLRLLNAGLLATSGQREPRKNERRSDMGDKEQTMFSIANDHYPMPSYLTTNDSVLQELIDRRRLIDALNASQLPAPYTINESGGIDPKTAGSLHHVDHGLMLFPAADEMHEKKSGKKSASASRKRGKHVQMKDRRKMSSASKKGGHKGRALDKEEKKFLKEKKFKGAKKGKKVSKGKGGAGGKKGKKLYKDKGYKKKGFKNVYHKEEWANKKSFFDEYRDKDFKKKWKKFDDKYNYAQMKKFQAKDEKGAKKLKHHNEDYKKYDKGKWRKNYQKHTNEHKELMKKKKKKTHEYE